MTEELKEEIYYKFEEVNKYSLYIQKDINNILLEFNNPVYQLSLTLILKQFLKSIEKEIFNISKNNENNKELKQTMKEIKKVLTSIDMDKEAFNLSDEQFLSLFNFKINKENGK